MTGATRTFFFSADLSPEDMPGEMDLSVLQPVVHKNMNTRAAIASFAKYDLSIG
jgi:hypothetical protein